MNTHATRVGLLLVALACVGTAAWAHTADAEASRSQLADILAAIRAYAMQHDTLPPKLSVLLDEGLADGPQSFVNPSGSTPLPRRAEVDEKGDYTLQSTPSAPDAIVREKRPTHTAGKVFAGFKDGSIKLVDAPAETATTTPPAVVTPPSVAGANVIPAAPSGANPAGNAIGATPPVTPPITSPITTPITPPVTPPPPPVRTDTGATAQPGTIVSPVSLTWIGLGPDRVGVRGPAPDGQPDGEFEIRYARGGQIVQMVNLSMATPTGQLCCQAWSTAGPQFFFLGVGDPASGLLGNAVGFTAQLGYPPETLRLYAPSSQWFAAGWHVVATVVFTDGTYISVSTVIGAGQPVLPPSDGLPVGAQQGANAGYPALVGNWAIACCNEELKGTLSITRQQGGAFSGAMSDPLSGDVTNGQLRGNSIEFDRSGGWGAQHWSAQLVNDRGSWRIVNGTWTGAYAERYPGRNNWHAEKK